MCQFCNADCTDWKCQQCEREFMREQIESLACEKVRQAAQAVTFPLPSYSEESPVC